MASVARAIEQAASKSVNGKLWWESHTATFYVLDKCGSVDASGVVGAEREDNSQGAARLVSFARALNPSASFRIFSECYFFANQSCDLRHGSSSFSSVRGYVENLLHQCW